MRRETTDEIEFTVACVNEFAQKHGMANVDALHYLDLHKGLDYVLDGYAVVRNQPLDLTLEDLWNVCRRNGGRLDMTTLYHGTNEPFDTPDPNLGRRGTDFGQGFYLTPDFDSAANIAWLSVMRAGRGRKVVMRYDFDEDRTVELGLKRRRFTAMDAEWMSFVIANRVGDREKPDHNLDRLYDIVDGLVADDKIVALLRRHQQGELSQEDILGILRQRPWRTVQYSFHTRKAVMCLCRKEVVYVS